MQAECFEVFLQETKSKVLWNFEEELQRLNALIEEQASQVKELKEKNNALCRHLNYYKKKSIDGPLLNKAASLPLEKAIVKAVSDFLQSQPWFKLMSKKNSS